MLLIPNVGVNNFFQKKILKRGDFMTALNRISGAIANKIRDNTKEIDEEKYEVIKYGIYIIIGDTTKFIIVLSLAYIFGILDYALITFISLCITKTISGGVHAKTWTKCLLSNIFIVFGTIITAHLLSGINPLIFTIFLYPACFILFFKYSPSDNENRPIKSMKFRKVLKTLSLMVISIQFFLASFYFLPLLSYILILTVVVNAVSILPVTYKLTGNKYGDSYDSTSD